MRSRAPAAAVLVLAVVFTVFALPATAHALILGFYGSGGFGAADWENSGGGYYDDDYYYYNGYDNYYYNDTFHGGAGVVLGTGSPASFLGYRVSIGYEQISFQGDYWNSDFTLRGVVIDQDLLFSLYRSQGRMRFWVGPELRLGFLNGSFDDQGGGDQDVFAVGLGPIMGTDFILSPTMGLSWKFGYLVSWYSGDSNYSGNDGRGDLSFAEGHFYTSLSILFSTWGGYPTDPVQQQQPPRYYPRP